MMRLSFAPAKSARCASAASLALLLAASATAAADEATVEPYVGQSVLDVLEAYRRHGVPLAYSTQLVSPRFRVRSLVFGDRVVSKLRDILEPHALTIREVDGLYLVVRDDAVTSRAATGAIVVIGRNVDTRETLSELAVSTATKPSPIELVGAGVRRLADLSSDRYELTVTAPGFESQTHVVDVSNGGTEVLVVHLAERPEALPDITVSTSRYRLPREAASSLFRMDQRAIQSLPDLGDDPLRAVHRLPGVAAGGVSAKSYVRGGDEDETAIFLNGLRLLDPFHVRDYQSLLSAVDLRAINAVDVFTGGFPVNYGDRMSGLILLESADPPKSPYTEVGLSVFNTSLLSSGWFGQPETRWLASIRNGNLDQLIDQKYGEPSFRDAFLELSRDLTPSWRLTGNALVADDRVSIFFENEVGEIESSVDRTRSGQGWLRLQGEIGAYWSVDTVLSLSELDSVRDALVIDEERLDARVRDSRDTQITALRQDWQMETDSAHLLRWGFEFQTLSGAYEYRAEAQHYGVNALLSGRDDAFTRDVDFGVDGRLYSLYLSDRWQPSDDWVVEAGIRWDKQSYDTLMTDSQLSPRFSVLYQWTPKTELRASWGRYHQSQAPWELPIEDGRDLLTRAQRADHTIVGLSHRFDSGLGVRVEAFDKKISDPRVRFENLFNPRALVPELEGDRIAVAAQSASASGIEVSLAGPTSSALDWWLSYTNSRVVDEIGGRSVSRAWNQRHALQAGLVWRGESWEVGGALGVHSGWPATTLDLAGGANGDEEARLLVGPRHADRLDTFLSLDVRVSRSFQIPHGNLHAFFELSNATDRKNDCCRDFDIVESASGDVLLERQRDYWLPLLPSAGLRWDF